VWNRIQAELPCLAVQLAEDRLSNPGSKLSNGHENRVSRQKKDWACRKNARFNFEAIALGGDARNGICPLPEV
jgi:hypothetical protein